MVDSIVPAALSKYQLEQVPQETNADELGQEDFLTIMMAQLKHQDPSEGHSSWLALQTHTTYPWMSHHRLHCPVP